MFFTSDTHFGHKRIIEYCDRPFKSTSDMDQALIENWNRVVGPDDVIYHLGDFCLGGIEMATKYFRQLNGQIYVLGNVWHHDRRWLTYLKSMNVYSKSNHRIRLRPSIAVYEFHEWPTNDNFYQILIMCHYPMAIWDRKHYGAWHVHGHSHGNYRGRGKILDVGVDVQNYKPISHFELKDIMDAR